MSIPCEVSGYCERGLDHDGPCGPVSDRCEVHYGAKDECGQCLRSALQHLKNERARVAELEAQLAAANADRARMMTALETVRDEFAAGLGGTGLLTDGEVRSLVVTAINSSDAAAWLRARDMRVAEAVREAVISAVLEHAREQYVFAEEKAEDAPASSEMHHIEALMAARAVYGARSLDLAAVVAGVKS